jgi:4-diphosphocytidyl-2-C-methyl-D-erythritol kinase
MKELTIKTPAKINIGLNILSKREDGYHNLETIFYPINLWDELTLREDDTIYFGD